jgi:hypothetical protein
MSAALVASYSPFDAMESSILDRIVAPFGLDELAVPAPYATRVGQLGAQRIELATRSWFGPGAIEAVHVARVRSADGSMDSLTFIALPRSAYGGPVVAADCVAFGGKLALFIVDVRSFGEPLPSEAEASLVAARERLAPYVEPRAWSSSEGPSPFSPLATFVRPLGPPPSLVRSSFEAYLEVGRAALARTSHAEPAEHQAHEAHEAHAEKAMNEHRLALAGFVAALARSKRQNQALTRLFGGDWIERYFGGWFFRLERGDG